MEAINNSSWNICSVSKKKNIYYNGTLCFIHAK